MRILHLDCGMGAAGDMLTAALLELLPEPERFVEEFQALGLPGVTMLREQAVKCGVTGTHIAIRVGGAEEGTAHEHEHAPEHAHLSEHTHTLESASGAGHAQEAEGTAHAPEHVHEHTHLSEHTHVSESAPAAGHTQEEEGTEHAHEHTHTHAHRSMAEITQLIEALPLPGGVRDDVLAVYRLLAEAESSVHGVPVTEIHFHEVGMMDAIADITAVCLLMHRLAPDRVTASPVHVGAGQVRCAHGILPVPAPATACLLRGIPIYGGAVSGELCTPTGAALLRYFVNDFGAMPVMKPLAFGYGMGKRDFEAANCVRAILGESGGEADTVLELSCNVDDMTAEEIGFALERLLDGGALEAYTVAAGMKKSRPGTLLYVLCSKAERDAVLEALFRHTTTLGVRESELRRHVLRREMGSVDTPLGTVRRKDAFGCGVNRFKYEYDDLARIARENDMTLAEARQLAGQWDLKEHGEDDGHAGSV